jgi:asparagine N-glycosylation enzyme membrane subunit Stt3
VQKISLPTLEQIFVLIAVITTFSATVYYMSTAGILPGNDPAVHLAKAEKIVVEGRITYSAVSWYPPLFHALLAVLQIFAGTLDIMVAAFILKMLIATLNVLILLSTYLLCRRLFGMGAAVASAVFTVLSVPLFEMAFWGGYANFLGLAYISFIFYIMNKDLQVSVKTFLLFLVAFTIVLSHQLATFVFVLMLVPAFLFSTIGSKKRLLVLLGLIVGGGLALLAWYARILLANSSGIIGILEHLFFTMEESVYSIPEVGLDALIRNNFGASLFLALAGIPLIYILFKKSLKALTLLVFWIAIPFILSQSYLFGLYLPYVRFVYFFATPIAILAGIFTYTTFRYSLTRFPSLIKSKFSLNIARKRAITIFSVALIITFFLLQSVFFIQRNETYPQFYERASIASYNSGLWIKQHSVPEGTIVTSRSPGTWFYLFSDYEVIQEIDPQYSRSSVAEALLYSFYEMDNTHTLNREYTSASSSAGQAIYASVYNIWRKGISISNKDVTVNYTDSHGEWVPFSLSETDENIYWTHRTADEAQLVSEYTHELFTVEKVVTFTSNSSVINIDWKVTANQNFPKAKMVITDYLNPEFQFREALIPGLLEWQNPWEKPSVIDTQNEWVLTEGNSSYMLDEDIMAIRDTKNRILAVFDFSNTPDFFSLGALKDHKIDALRLRYELDDMEEGESREISFSVLFYALESEEMEQWTMSEIKQLLELKTERKIQESDFYSFIEEYNIKFVVVDTQQVLSNIEATPDLDKIYDNSRTIVYTTKR